MLSCGHFYAQNGYSVKRQDGKTPLIIYIIKGHLHLVYNDNIYIAHSGEVLLIDCNNPHHYYCDKYCSFQFMHFSGNNSKEVVTHLIKQNNSPVFNSKENIDLYNELDVCTSLLQNNRLVSEVKLSQILYNCICILQSSNEVYLEKISDSSKIITNAIFFIKQNLHRPIALKDIANHVNISTHYFAHLFKEEIGTSPIEYVAITKINHAKTMLTTTNSSIREISEFLGYSSSSSFINAFKSRVGSSPNKFRQSNIDLSVFHDSP
jgi:AraC-like DNA-binding protein